MVEDEENLDKIFKQHLQIMRPYLNQLVDHEIIEKCNSWIKKLSNCNEAEKVLRNKYVFVMCYQLARGLLDEPFIDNPPNDKLQPFTEKIHSEQSSEVDCIEINSIEICNARDLYSDKISVFETELLSQTNVDINNTCINCNELDKFVRCRKKYPHNELNQQKHPNNLHGDHNTPLFSCPKIKMQSNIVGSSENNNYEYRANNLIQKLREIKKQNMLLQKELRVLKDTSTINFNDDGSDDDHVMTNNNSVSNNDIAQMENSNITLKALKEKLQEVQNSRKALIEKIADLQQDLDTFEDIKRLEINKIKEAHTLNVISIQTSVREETKAFYETKLEDMKKQFEFSAKIMDQNYTLEIGKTKAELNKTLAEKENAMKTKDLEMTELKNTIELQKNQISSLFIKLLDKPDDTERNKTYQLEKQFQKLEKSKNKCLKSYEAKLSNIQKEKHLMECTLQMQLVKQRAQVMSEVTDENQAELATALDKLETKYKEIIANVQTTAIQRRLQDQAALENLLQACGLTENSIPNVVRTTPNQYKERGNEFSTLMLGRNKVGNILDNSFGGDSVTVGYCLDGERFGELFEKVCIPQRDVDDGPN